MLERSVPRAAVLLLAWAAPATAQLIPIRTVPISQSHQFDFSPSRRLAMGGVSIAVDDSLHDPFLNPARGARLGASRFFGAPALYSVTLDAGAGRTLPAGALIRSGEWFAAAMLVAQQVDLSERTVLAQQFDLVPCLACRQPPAPVPGPDRSNGNLYAHAAIGRVLPGAGLALGGSLSWARLRGVDGTDLLYAGSARLRQRGHALDARVGALKDWPGDRTLSAVVVHHRYASTHDVFYVDPVWDPGSMQFAQRIRLEENLDHTNTWGLELTYAHPVRTPGWRVGWRAAANAMSHPKIPNYEIQNIPRDPGNSEALNLGVGVSKQVDGSTFGLDVVFEPIWSHTWADAAAAVQTATGGTIPAGGRTIENWFRFANGAIRMGFAQDLELGKGGNAVGLQLGLAVRTVNYTLRQRDHVQARWRHLDADWVEWTPTWGLGLRFPAWEIHYRGSVIGGTGRPGVFGGDVPVAEVGHTNILVAPSGPLSLARVQVLTHQVSVSFPIR